MPELQRTPVTGVIQRAGATAWAMLGLIILGFVFFRYLFEPVSVVVAPIVVAAVIVYLLHPLVTVLERVGLPRWFSVAIVFTAFLVGVGLLFSWAVPLLVRQVGHFVDEAPGYAQRFVDEVNQFSEGRGFSWRLDLTREDIGDFFRDNREQIISFLGGIGNVAGKIIHLGVTAVLGVILSIYLLVDLPGMRNRMQERIPTLYRRDVEVLAERIGVSVGGFFRGQLLVAAFVGVASSLALTWPVGLPFAALVGLIAGIFNLVPLIGPFLAMIPAIALGLLSDDPIKALWASIALLVVQQIDNHVISPNVMGRTVQLHPITVMLGLLVGGTIAGIFGMLVTIPLIAVSKVSALFLWERQRHLFVPVGDSASPSSGQVPPSI